MLSTETVEVSVPATATSEGDNYKLVVSNESTETNTTTGKTTIDFDLTMYKNDAKVSGGDVIYKRMLARTCSYPRLRTTEQL